MKSRFATLASICLCAAAPAFSQGSHPTHAVMVIECDSTPNGSVFYLTRFHAAGLEYDRIDSARSKDDREIQFSFVPDPGAEYQLQLGDRAIEWNLFFNGGDSIVIRHSPTRTKLAFDKIGANALFRDSSGRPRSQWDFHHTMGERDWNGMCQYVDDQERRMKAGEARLTTEFPKYTAAVNAIRAAEIHWYLEARASYFDKYLATGNGIPGEEEQHLRFLDSVPWNDASLKVRNELDDIVTQWMNLKMWVLERDHPDSNAIAYQNREFALARSLPPPAGDVAVMTTLEGLNYMKVKDAVRTAEDELSHYRSSASDPAYAAKFEGTLEKLRNKLPGRPAPEFSLPDTNGTAMSLHDFRGKIVYLDFWGNWCGPCLEEIPALKKLQERFAQDTSVVFVGIALEASESRAQTMDAWKMFIVNKELGGVQLYADDQFHNPYTEQYDITSVPIYMILNRDGTFFDAAAPRPSSGKAEAEIRAALTGNGQ